MEQRRSRKILAPKLASERWPVLGGGRQREREGVRPLLVDWLISFYVSFVGGAPPSFTSKKKKTSTSLLALFSLSRLFCALSALRSARALSLRRSLFSSLAGVFCSFFSTEARRERVRSKGTFKLTVNELCEKLNPLPSSSFFSTAALAPASSRSTRRPATEASTAPRRPSSRWPSQRKRTFPSRPSRTRSSTAAPEGRARSPSESVSFFVSFFSFVVAREGTEFLFLRERGSAALSLAGDPSSLFLY